jgi:hypothetical protein
LCFLHTWGASETNVIFDDIKASAIKNAALAMSQHCCSCDSGRFGNNSKKVAQKIRAAAVLFKNLPKVNHHPMGKNSANLVILVNMDR